MGGNRSSLASCALHLSVVARVTASARCLSARAGAAATAPAVSLISPLAAVSDGRNGRLVRGLGDIRAGVGELGVAALDGGAAVADVGDEEVGAAAEAGAGLRGAADLLGADDVDGRAVHVHLAVADLVEPRPREEGLARGGVAGDLEGEGRVADDGAVADVRVDDLERLAAVEGERGLARAAVVGSAAGDGHAVRLAGSPVGDSLALRRVEEGVVALAREVAAAGAKRVLHVVVDARGVLVELGAQRRGVLHLHVGRRQAQEGGSEDRKGLHGDG